MRREELDEISIAFRDAWRDYFGDLLYYIPLSKQMEKDDVYLESKHKKYDFDKKVQFYGTLKEEPKMDELMQTGKRVNKQYEIVCVTKELIDGGITKVDTNSLIMYVDRFGEKHFFSIFDEYQKVQFSTDKIFTKIRVIPSVYK